MKRSDGTPVGEGPEPLGLSNAVGRPRLLTPQFGMSTEAEHTHPCDPARPVPGTQRKRHTGVPRDGRDSPHGPGTAEEKRIDPNGGRRSNGRRGAELSQ